jgi:tRNA (cmo5U34)-methyltransferase
MPEKRDNMSDFRESAWADKRFAESYLDKADIYIVERRRMFGIASSLFAYFFNREEAVRILDLGCGDGVLTEELLKTHHAASATLVDGNEGMLQKARERLKPFQRTYFMRASFQEILAGQAELEKYDLCISSMAIHHLEKSEKDSLFRYIALHLNPAGRFVDIDVVLPPSEELEGWYFSLWRDWLGDMMRRYYIKDEEPEELIRRYKDPASSNKPDTLGDQLKALKEAGFRDVDCYYKNGIFAVFGGKLEKKT